MCSSKPFGEGQAIRLPLPFFDYTSEFRAWLDTITVEAPFCTVDRWTYGRVLVEPCTARWRELRCGGSVEKTAASYQWTWGNMGAWRSGYTPEALALIEGRD